MRKIRRLSTPDPPGQTVLRQSHRYRRSGGNAWRVRLNDHRPPTALITRRQELDALQPPEPLDRRSRPPGGGKQDVRVQEDPVHASGPGGLVVRDRRRVQAHAADLGHGAGVIGGIDGVGQEELSLTFGGVDLDREDQGRPDQDPTLAGLRRRRRTLPRCRSVAGAPPGSRPCPACRPGSARPPGSGPGPVRPSWKAWPWAGSLSVSSSRAYQDLPDGGVRHCPIVGISGTLILHGLCWRVKLTAPVTGRPPH